MFNSGFRLQNPGTWFSFFLIKIVRFSVSPFFAKRIFYLPVFITYVISCDEMLQQQADYWMKPPMIPFPPVEYPELISR